MKKAKEEKNMDDCIKKVCSRCKRELMAPAKQSGVRVISQAICRECWNQIWADRLQSSREIVDSFDSPVLLLDNNLRIQAANDPAQKILGRPLADIKNFLPGDAMECINARLPSGCGQTMHCQACALRRALEMTMTTGTGVEKSPAFQDTYQGDGSVLRHFYYISTEKIEDFILLRIDEVQTFATSQAARRPEVDNSVS
jgi:PAS domain-containing protein